MPVENVQIAHFVSNGLYVQNSMSAYVLFLDSNGNTVSRSVAIHRNMVRI